MDNLKPRDERRNLINQENYWRKVLDGLPMLKLPLDYPRPPVPSYVRDRETIELNQDIIISLKTFCNRENLTLFTTLIATFKIILFRCTGNDDLIVGTLSSDSLREGKNGNEETFVNPVGLRTDLAGNPSANELLKRIAKTVELGKKNRDYPIEKLNKLSDQNDELAGPSIFQVMFLLVNVPDCLSDTPISEEDIADSQEYIVQCDLVIKASEQGEDLVLECEYDTDLFESDSIKRMLEHFQTLLSGLIARPDAPILMLPILTEGQRHQLLVEWNETQVDYPPDMCLHQLFEAQVERSPNATALIFENQRLTYQELNMRANQLAHHLQKAGVGCDSFVGIFMERSLEMVVSLYATLKAGGAYVPLDPEYPPDRLAFMVQEAKMPVLLTQERLVEKLPEHNAQVIFVDSHGTSIDKENTNNPVTKVTAENLAYVIYTSGSTGKPKGVMNAHAGICNRLHWMQDAYQLTADDCVLQKTPFSFDVSVWEFFWPLLFGARLVVARPGGHKDNAYLVRAIIENKVTTLHFVPSMLQMFLEEKDSVKCQCLKRVICSGEALPYELQQRFFERLDAELHNLYGPTEAAVDVTYWACQRYGDHRNVPIGRPIANTQIYLLDSQLQPVPVGALGELHIGGVQVAKGYLNRPELTAEKFIRDPFSKEQDARLYKTGDLARYLCDGNIEFVGRIDHQVKIRGFRIEIGEIETILAQYPNVRETVILLREDSPGDQRLVAYVVANQKQIPTISDLHRFLREKLPEYMVPAAFVILDAMPLTSNGKVDRRALPAPESQRPELDTDYIVPQSEAERFIAETWQEVLQVEKVGIHDNFFDLGGHSLLLVKVRAKLQEIFDQELSTTELFQYPTVEALAKYLSRSSDDQRFSESQQKPKKIQTSSKSTTRDSEIAVIGMACRLPGAKDIDAFWQNLHDGVESVTFLSDEELISAGVDPTLLEDPNYVKASVVLEDADFFDASFFGFSPKEAEMIDPQQRLFLECAWNAIENAGYNLDACDWPIGVYAGVGMNAYLLHNLSPNSNHDPGGVGAFQLMIGNDKDFLPTRVSYKLNLKGPSINIQTACSTSLVAVHMAGQGLINGECRMALAGGVSIHLPQKTGYLYQEGMILSPDGHCRTFDARAQGTVFGSGVGIVILKRLQDAIEDGDTIHAIIKGSAINNDGSLKVGYTAPSVDGQAAVITQAQATAGIEAETVTYIEAHGTATPLGDPIEIAALTKAFRASTQKKGFCAIGSLKTNIGHVDAAAGVGGLIKTILAMKHKLVPPSLHFEKPNPQIDFDNSPFYVATQLAEWKTNGTPRRAGVSSFGIGGTNCHLIVEEAPEPSVVTNSVERPQHLLSLSAKSEQALLELAQWYSEYLSIDSPTQLADICYTANTGRMHFEHRLAVVADSISLLRGYLEKFVSKKEAPELQKGQIDGGHKPPQVAFLFTGQGAQFVGMGRELYDTQPTFRAALDRCDTILRQYLEKPLIQVLYPELEEESPLNETAYTQPALFAIEYALAQLWQSWGIIPSVVMGHSVGEYVAACIAGVFSLEDGLKLIAARGRLMQALPQDGDMVAVMADEAGVVSTLESYPGDVAIAALNGPKSVVISGKREAIQAVINSLEADGIKSKKLTVSHAFHSPLMDPILDDFEKVAREVSFSAPKIDLISNVNGDLASKDVYTPEYWRRHIRQPVRFAAGMETLHKQGYDLFLEIGPQPILLGMGRQCLPGAEGVWLPSLRQRQSDCQQMLASLGALYTMGVSVDWEGFDRDYKRRRVMLPGYPFQRQRHWVDAPSVDAKKRSGFRQEEYPDSHPLLGHQLRLPLSQEVRFESFFSRHSPPYNEDHRVFGILVVPGVSHMAMFLQGVHKAFEMDAFMLEELFFLQPFVLSEDGGRTGQLIFEANGAEEWAFKLVSLREKADANDPASWTVHASGKVNVSTHNPTLPIVEPFDIPTIQDRCQKVIDGADFYANFWVQGADAGPSFRWNKKIWKRDGEALGQTEFPGLSEDVSVYQLYPGLIEASLQVMRCCWDFESAPLLAKGGDIYVPFSIESFRFYGRPNSNQLWCHASIPEKVGPENKSVLGDLHLLDKNGNVIAAIIGFEVRRISREHLLRNLQQDPNDWLVRISWQAKTLETKQPSLPGEKQGNWLIFADQENVGNNLAALLKQRGESCTLVFPHNTYKLEDNENVTINPEDPQHFHQLLEDIGKRQSSSLQDHPTFLRGVVYLWGLDGDSGKETNPSTLQNAQILGCAGTLHLIQALAKIDWKEYPRLWIVTRGTQQIEPLPEDVTIHQAALWGLGRVIALEHPELQCVRLDLAPSKESSEVQNLAEELSSNSSEDQIAYRKGVRHIARLIRHSVDSPASESKQTVNKDSSYLITGGLGGLGLKVAGWLVTQGAQHIVLTGRRGPTATSQKAIEELEAEGAKILVLTADVSKPGDVVKLFENIKLSMPPLRGIIHAAGVLDDGTLMATNWNNFSKVMAPKVIGTWNLHTQTKKMKLDFFVCFSSATSLIGAPGQGNYAAANAFMDTLAHYRQSQDIPGVSINWGPWAEVGMAAELQGRDRRRQEEQGWTSIALDQGLRILGDLINPNTPQVGVLPVNWLQYIEQFSSDHKPPFLSELTRSAMPIAGAKPPSAPQQKFLQRLQDAPESDRLELLTNYVEKEVANLLGLNTDGQSIDLRQGFAEMGMDSLMGIELRSRLQRGLDISLSSTFALDYSNIEDITSYLKDRLFLTTPTESASAPQNSLHASNEIVEKAKQLSGDELTISIEEELAKLEASLKNE